MNIELNKKLEKLIEENKNKILKSFRNYRKGFITKEDLQDDIYQVFYSYQTLLSHHHIRTKITSKNWSDFLADFEMWADKGVLDSKSNQPWLISPSGNEPMYSAPKDEKEIFFRIMKIQGIPIEYYKPRYEHIKFIPKMNSAVYGDADKWYILNIIDDGGLMNEQEPIGKCFILTDEYGLKTEIKIEKVGVDCANCPSFGGKGTIEGYTSSTPVDIEIWTNKNNKVHSVNTYIYTKTGAEHYDAYRNFPLWQEYFEESGKQNDIYFECRDAFFKKYWEELWQTEGEYE